MENSLILSDLYVKARSKSLSFIPVKVVGVEFCQKACEAFFAENQIEFEKKESVYVAKTKSIKIYCGDFFTCPITEKVEN